MSDLVQLGTVVDINPESISRDFPFDEIEYVDISSVGSGTSNEPRKISIEEGVFLDAMNGKILTK